MLIHFEKHSTFKTPTTIFDGTLFFTAMYGFTFHVEETRHGFEISKRVEMAKG